MLDETGLAENTMIVYSSDNGPETTWKERIKKFDHHSNGIYREGKRSIYEGGHRVPFFVRWPAKVEGGREINGTVCQTDLLATFAEMLGTNLPNEAGEDSVSFYSSIIDPKAEVSPRPPLIMHGANGRFAIRDGKWKLVMETKKKNEKRELYDLSVDPGEAKNVLSDNPEVEKRLVAAITKIVEDGRSTPGETKGNDTPNWDDLVWIK
jgi:arylsulfatase A